MKKEDLPVLKQKVLDMLPVSQADMWKTLGIDSKEGSSLVSIMLNERLIMRTRHDGHFLLEKMNGNGHEKHIDNKDLEVLKEGEDLKKDTGEVLGKKREKGVEYLKQKVLEMLPITQADMWKALDIDSSYGSRLADAMVKENLITKKRHDGSFLLEKISANGDPKVTNSENLEKLKEEELKRKEDEKLKEEELKRKEDEKLKEEELKRKEDEKLKEEELKRKEDEKLKEEELKRKEDEKLKDEKLKKEADEKLKKETVEDIKKNRDKGVSYLKQKVLEMLPVTQADMWKSLGIDSSHGSRLADAMVKENLITRKKLGKGFLLERLCEDKSKDKKIDFSVLLSSNNRFSPCGGCTLVCDAATCTLLSEWLLE